jgi:Spy/CpxP family protein refolding chaperone
MKVTKTMIIAALVAGNLLAWNLSVRAADTNTPTAGAPTAGHRPLGMGMRGPNLDQFAKMLNLTDDQKVKVKPILEARDKKMADLHADTALSLKDRQTQIQSLQEETTTQMKAVLTSEQFDKYQKITQRVHRPGGLPAGAAKAGSTNAPAAASQN